MASVYYGVNRGQTEFAIVTASTTNGTDIELRFDQTKSLTKQEVLQAIEMIKHTILKDATNWGL